MPESVYASMTDHQLRREIIELAKLKPEPMGTIRVIQSVFERRYHQELTAKAPDQRRLADLRNNEVESEASVASGTGRRSDLEAELS